jgi:hypothetical protein
MIMSRLSIVLPASGPLSSDEVRVPAESRIRIARSRGACGSLATYLVLTKPAKNPNPKPPLTGIPSV